MIIKAAVFDLDGTLFNTLTDLAGSCNRALEDFGFPPHSEEQYRYIIGNGIDRQMERAIPPQAYTPQVALQVKAAFLRYYDRDYLRNTRPYQGVAQTLAQLRERGVRLAVLSNKPDSFTHAICGLLPELFDLVQGGKDGVPLKPDPTALLAILQGLQVAPQQCIYCGDSGVDMCTGRRAGACTVGAAWGFREEEELWENGAQQVIHHPQQLLELLDWPEPQDREVRR